jgi:peptidoglycan/xylan/chitin deacetylase (PgdA/CDA1 family)
MYHGVSSVGVEPAQMDRHFAFFARHFDCRFFSELDQPDTARRPTLVLTFDDGMRNNFECAVPLLEKHGLKATFFIVAGIFDGLRYLWNHRLCFQLYALPDALLPLDCEPLPADPEGLRLRSQRWRVARRQVERYKQLAHDERLRLCRQVDEKAAGAGIAFAEWFDREFRLAPPDQVRDRPACVEYGSHTVNHPILTSGLDDGLLAEEIEGSRHRLQQETGDAIDTFCFPNGDNDQRVRSVVARHYRLACTTVPGMHRAGGDPRRILRVPAAAAVEDMVSSLLRA